MQGNYIDSTGTPFVSGDDNAIAFVKTHFDSVEYVDNTAITHGESLELEGAVASRVDITGNTISTSRLTDSTLARIVTTVGYPRLHGGHPASIKMAGNDVRTMSIRDNDVVTGGGTSTAVCIMQYEPVASVYPTRSTSITGNRCRMSHIFAGLLAGWAGTPGFFEPGILQNATVADNSFTGSASFGIAALDFRVRLAPAQDLVNTSNHNVFRGNDLSGFTPGQASLYLGPSTHDNTFHGDPHGPVVNRGTNNHIVVTP